MSAGSLTSQPRASVFTPSCCKSSAACWQRSFLRAPEHQVGAHFRQPFCDLTSQPDGASGDDRDAASEVEKIPHIPGCDLRRVGDLLQHEAFSCLLEFRDKGSLRGCPAPRSRSLSPAVPPL